MNTTGTLATTYAYDPLDELLTVNQGSQTRSFKYDSLGRLTRQKLAEQTATINDGGTYVGAGGTGANWSDAFTYDARSNVTQRIDARGVKANYSYLISGAPDALNRLQGISYDASSADTTYTIDAAPSVSVSYMTAGDQTRVSQVSTSGVATEQNSYDSYGRISAYLLTMSSRTSYPFETDYSYDSANRLTQVTYPSQYGMTGSPRHAVAPSYDQASRLTQMNVDSSTYLGNISYNTNSQVTQLKVGAATANPRLENYSYDPQTGLLTAQTVTNVGATSTYMDLNYAYSRGGSAGTLTGKTGQMTNMVDNLDHNRDRKYEFDVLDRLATAKGGTNAGATSVTAGWTQSYSYDRYGNKTSVSASGVDQTSASIPTDGLASVSFDTSTNRINGSGWTYDNAGNLIRGQEASGTWQRFEYDAAGRLVKIKDDSGTVIETYTYGATRERLVNETSSGRTYYVWGGSSVVAEYTEATSSTTPSYNKSYVYAGSRLLMTETKVSGTTETPEFYHPNRLGTRLVTNSSAGTYYQQSTLPFGTALAAESTGYSNQLFTTYDRDSISGFDYADNRTYSKGQGRFTQVDPLGMGATTADPGSNNLYVYVQNDPLNYVDPSGLNMSDGGEACSYSGDKDADGNPVYDGHIVGGKCVGYSQAGTDIYWEGIWWDPSNYDPYNWNPNDSGWGNPNGSGVQPSSTTKSLQTTSLAATACGAGLSVAQLNTADPGYWIASNGKLYSNLFRGNQYVGGYSSAMSASRGLGVVGGAVGLAGVAVSAVQYHNGDISGYEFGADTVMTGVGVFGGAPGAAASVTYFGVKAIVAIPDPGGVAHRNMRRIQMCKLGPR